MYLTNAFSLQMLDLEQEHNIQLLRVEPTSAGVARYLLTSPDGFTSAVGHADTAAVLSGLLGIDIPANRISITLTPVDTLIVAQLIGGRLPEGATELPDGFEIKFVRVALGDGKRG